MTKQTENLCECGHEKNEHYFTNSGCMVGRHPDDEREICPCNKFRPKKKEVKND